jgi:hypothetical protein
MNQLRLAIILNLLAMAFLSNASAQSAQTFVATSGSDGNPCTSAAAPCHTLQGAAVKTAAGGTVNILDSNDNSTCGSGTLTINKSMTINGGGNKVIFGCYTSPAAIRVVTGNAGIVTLRDIDIQSEATYSGTFGSVTGIEFTTGGILRIQNVRIDGFQAGISATHGNLIVQDTTINADPALNLYGMSLSEPAVDIERTHIRNAHYGLDVANASHVSIRNSDISAGMGGPGTRGINVVDAGSGTEVNVDSSTIAFHNNGVVATGVGAVVRLNNCFMAANTLGASGAAGGHVESFGNNRFVGGALDGTVTLVSGK